MKRLIVCCDGTWNKLSNPCPTNVIKLAQAITSLGDDGIPQIVLYEEGLGTQWYSKLAGGAFGWGIDQIIQNAYRFLCLNYDPGDEIYLFGFSRGAYTVRSLAGMMHCSGLLSRDHICKAPAAYQLYRDRDIKPSSPEAQAFRAIHGERVPITLLGCWDTVGSLGVPDMVPGISMDNWLDAQYRFHDTRLSSSIQHALHAVAIDEIRKVYNVTPMQTSSGSTTQVLRQVWFPGCHGCIGGGTEANRGLSDGALQWMMESTSQLGLKLKFDPTRIQAGLSPNPTIDFDQTLKLYERATGTIERTVNGTAEDLHSSVKYRWQRRSDYRPDNLKAFQSALAATR